MNSTSFFRELPAATRPHLSTELRKFRSETRSWLAQLYYTDARLHYEVWNLGEHRGKMEIGLHFESRDRTTNDRYLAGFQRHMIEVKAKLGEDWEAEPWEKGWTKVYATIEREAFTEDYLERVARQLAGAMAVLQPIFEDVQMNRVASTTARTRRR
ncbi:MAG: hypothetical protein HY260_18050 [Chloroflexi bacterium]|nr:hypothetical protein [Chloroflexota bacterium]